MLFFIVGYIFVNPPNRLTVYPLIGSKCKGVGMLFVCFVSFFVDALPNRRVDLREEGIGILPCVVYVRDLQLINQWHELFVYFSSADNKHILIGCEHLL